ncbi:MAG: hypothetical protein Q9213_001438 [Squamulea squamosa]
MTTSSNDTNPTKTYYDDPGTDRFYTLLWGGQDIHTGIYTSPTDTITFASQQTVVKAAETLQKSGLELSPQTRVLDLGAGYGGAARYLAKTYGCQVVSLNLSPVQNQRNEELNRAEGLEAKTKVVEGVFEVVPASVGDGFDVVWSLDSFLHSLDRWKIVDEIDRLLRKDQETRVVFTDIMASNDAFEKQPELMKAMMDRLHLSDLGTLDFYKKAFEQKGFSDLGYWDGIKHFKTHYRRLGDELKRRKEELMANEGVDEAVVERHTGGMRRWVKAAEKGCVEWGILCFGR